MSKVRRVVIGPNGADKSAVLHEDAENFQEAPGFFWRSTLWATRELPPDNDIRGDRAVGVIQREPEGSGLIFRALEIPPDPPDRESHLRVIRELHERVRQRHVPTTADLKRHPSMHRTDTLDLFTVARGEVYLMTDTDEVLLKQGDTAVVQGVNHAWSNRSKEPCMIMCVLVHARTPEG
ncbi:MAG: cupin domain-containing protein [Acetobacteraceae bacterium]